ncbi:MAG: hypothetical protein ACRBHB_00520 [Arenicella sp.]
MSQLTELRRIIVGEQADQLHSLKERLEQSALRSKDVAEVLPDAIKLSHKDEEKALSSALAPLLGDAVQQTIKRDPQKFADVFYPVMAPSIRLTIANAIRSLMSSINQSVESTTSVKGLRWRFESIRSGVPYAELALRNMLEYRVEQVFVMEKQAGLLIDHLVNENVAGLDSDAVSAMLTAIQSFVRESFSANDDENLTNMAVGELNVWLIHGRQAVLACVIRGEAPTALRGQLMEILDEVHRDYAEQLNEFHTTQPVFPGLHEKLEPCLQLKLKDYEGERKKISWVTWLLLGALVIGFLSWIVHDIGRNNTRNQTTKLLSAIPGVLPTDVFWERDKLNVVGLIDPVAQLPWEQLSQLGVNRDNLVLSMKKFRSLEPAIVITRLRSSLKLPAEVAIEMDDSSSSSGESIIYLSGSLDYSAYRNLLRNKQLLSSIGSIDMRELILEPLSINTHIDQQIGIPSNISMRVVDKTLEVDGVPESNWFATLSNYLQGDDLIQRITAADWQQHLQNKLQAKKVLFSGGLALEAAEQDNIDQLTVWIKELQLLLEAQSLSPRIRVVGFTDNVGAEESNRTLRRERAELVVQELISKGVSPKILQVDGVSHQFGSSARAVRLIIAEEAKLERN